MEAQPPQLELYIDTNDERLNSTIQDMISSLELAAVVQQTLHNVHIGQAVMLSLLITDDKTIRDMNQQYREQNKPTDVLSFPLLDHPLVQAPPDQLWGEHAENPDGAGSVPAFVTPPEMITNLGDIVISWPTMARQALEAEHSPLYELLYLLVHGVLHLVGYDDQTEAGYEAMVAIQKAVLEAVGRKV